MSAKIQHYRTAESVSPKHPDKICDQISDAILDAYLAEDSFARVAVDVAGGHGTVFVTGEVSSRRTSRIDISSIVKRIAGDVTLINHIAPQSKEIARGVDQGGAGDQGIMVGYACDETPELLPLEVVLSRRLNQALYQRWPYDGKTQVTVSGRKIVGVVASFQHVSREELESAVRLTVGSLVGEYNLEPSEYILYVNPCGDWDTGGFDADAGLTGRKLAVDNYGPRVPIGGGAFSGKDPSKVDRSAAYMARRIAVDQLRTHRAHEVVVRLAYAIGVVEPLELTVCVDGVYVEVNDYDLAPNAIIEALDLRRPIYEETATYGHFGRGFSWDVDR